MINVMAGLIFADSGFANMNGLLNKRTHAAIPFGAHYRMIDFPLSSLANAGVRNVGIIVKKNYQSLMSHIGSGADWDLDRKNSGITILPPFSTEENTDTLYKNRLEGIIANRTYLSNLSEQYVLITGATYIANLDLVSALEEHRASGLPVSALYTENAMIADAGTDRVYYSISEDQMVRDMAISGICPPGFVTGLNSFIMERNFLLDVIDEAMKTHKHSLRNDVLYPMMKEGEVHSIKMKGDVLFADSVSSYLRCNLALLDRSVRWDLFRSKNGPIITKNKDVPPAKYGSAARVENSLIADDVTVEGTVRDSVLFRGVRVESGAVVEHSVILPDSVISRDAELSYAVLDRKVVILPGRRLAGYLTHPFVLERNSRV